MLKLTIAVLTCILAASAAHAQPQVKVVNLGMPGCAAFTRTPDFASNYYIGDQHDSSKIPSPWFSFSPFYNQHAQFNGLLGNSNFTSTARYEFATPQTAVTFVIGNPESYHFFEFWKRGSDVPIAFIDGSKIGSPNADYYVSLSLTGNTTFDAFTFAVQPPQFAALSYANFDAVCPK